MGSWLQTTSVEFETFILKDSRVTDLEEFSSNHDRYLTSISLEPLEAARWWHWQRARIDPGEGWVSIKLDRVEIMPSEAWTHVESFWLSLLDAVDDYQATGKGQGSFSGESEGLSLVARGLVMIFEVRGNRYPVDPQSFLKALLIGAQNYLSWANENIGTVTHYQLERVEDLLGQMSRH